MATCNASIARPRGGVAIRDLDVTGGGVSRGRQVGEGVKCDI